MMSGVIKGFIILMTQNAETVFDVDCLFAQS